MERLNIVRKSQKNQDVLGVANSRKEELKSSCEPAEEAGVSVYPSPYSLAPSYDSTRSHSREAQLFCISMHICLNRNANLATRPLLSIQRNG